jgi:hypothetical protein
MAQFLAEATLLPVIGLFFGGHPRGGDGSA